MSRGGYRKGAGRKREYQEPVQKILIGLPESVLQKLDDYAKRHNLSRPKAIASLLEKNLASRESGSEMLHSNEPQSVNQVPVQGEPESIQKPKAIKKQKLLDELKALKNSLGT